MVIVLKTDISATEKTNLRAFLERNKFKTNEIIGENETILGAVGSLSIDPREVEILPGVDRVIPISKPYKMASREFKKENTIVEIPNNRGQIIKVGGTRIIAIAGPCAVESRQQMMDAAKAVAEAGTVMLRGGAYKPRTSPYAFQGLGEEGLRYLKEAGDAYGLPVVTEIVSAEHIPVMKNYVDVYQVGARNMQNFELLKKLGALGKPVILKRGLSATIEEWLMAAEYLLSSGTNNVILCERGIRTYEKATRNTLDLSAIPILRPLTHLPIIVDPSHAVGIRDKVPPMGLAAVAAGADGIIVEVHCNPDKALSDGAQSLYPQQFDKLMRDIDVLAPVLGKETYRIRTTAVSGHASEPSKTTNKTTCAFAGSPGAYAEIAVRHFFDNNADTVPCKNFRDVFQSVLDGKADYGMIPVENSLAGCVYDNYDNIIHFEDIAIAGSIKLRIQHTLGGLPGATAENISCIYSHPQALSQCSAFLRTIGSPEQIEASSTAEAAQVVAKKGSTTNAVIASEEAVKKAGLTVLKTGIEDDPRNYTRFIVIYATNTGIASSEQQSITTNGTLMASVAFATKNEPGALYDCLGIFKKHNVNLVRLESRPIHGKPWQYMFYGDMAPIADTEALHAAIAELATQTESTRLLGLYPEVN